MTPVGAALSALQRAHRAGFFSEEDWDEIIARWDSGISEGVIYDALKAAGTMPYKTERSFYRALDNQKGKRNVNKRWTWNRGRRPIHR